MSDESELEIVIGTSPSSGLSLRGEIHLLKPALLYADRVRLYSPLATLLSGVAAMGYAEGADRINILASLAKALGMEGADQVEAALQALDAFNCMPRAVRRGALGKQQAKELANVTSKLEATWGEMRAKVDEILGDAGAEEMVPALENGLLTIEPLFESEEPDSDEILRVFMDKLGSLLASGTAYPLFDDQTGSLVTAGVAEGVFVPSSGAVTREREAGSAAELLNYMPAFPPASVGEILGIREELKGPLVRFRSAMVKIAAVLQAAPREAGFKEELEQIYRAEVEPALQEIREEVQSNRYLHQLLGETVKDIPKWLGAGFIAIATTPLTNIPALVVAGATAAGPAAQAAWKKHERSKEIRQRQYYFLYETDRLLD